MLEMCAAMCLGATVLDPLYGWAAGLAGYGDPFLQLPEVTTLVVAPNMTVPMVAWMRFRGMDWRNIAEIRRHGCRGDSHHRCVLGRNISKR